MARTLLIATSLALNAALLTAMVIRPAIAPASLRTYLLGSTAASSEIPTRVVPVRTPGSPPAKLWSRLDAGADYAAWIARLRQAGFPPNVIRSVVSMLMSDQLNARERAILGADPNTPYWTPRAPLFRNSKELQELYQIGRENSKLERELFGDVFFATENATATQRRQFGPLTRQKVDAVQRIEDDYAEMESQVRAAMGGVALPEDKEKLAMLVREKQADLAAVLTPDELAEYKIRSSPLTRMLTRQLGGFDPTEAEFRAIFAAQDQYGQRMTNNGTTDVIVNDTDRETSQQQLGDQLKATLGTARYADYVRETDPTFQQLTRLAQRDNVPKGTIHNAYQVRDAVVEASNRIYDDSTLSTEQKTTALQTLAQSARSQLLAMLGPNSGPAYVAYINQRWLDRVEQGSAVRFVDQPSIGTISMSSAGVVAIGSGYTTKFRRLPSTATTPSP